jgi:hypothetical protein
MVVYVMEDGQAQWVTAAGALGDRGSLLDEWTEQFFPATPEATTFNIFGAYYAGDVYEYPAYAGPAPLADLPAPTLEVIEESVTADGLRQVHARIVLHQNAPMHVLQLEADEGMVAVKIMGRPLDKLATPMQPAQLVWIELYAVETTTIDLELTLAGAGSLRVLLEERLYRLPDLQGFEITPRPRWMMPSPTFVTDSSLIRTSFVLP